MDLNPKKLSHTNKGSLHNLLIESAKAGFVTLKQGASLLLVNLV